MKFLLSAFFLFVTTFPLLAQWEEALPEAIQFSGFVVTGPEDQVLPVPFATIAVKGTARGTYANYAGFYSLAVRPRETLIFSAIGFKTKEVVVPDTIRTNKFNYICKLEEDTIVLPEAVVYPWPSRTFLRQEFLAMNVEDDIQVRVQENLMKETMEELRIALTYDPKETTRIAMRQNVDKLYYQGQLPPNYMSVFNPMAWFQFFKAIKNGDFKKKDKRHH